MVILVIDGQGGNIGKQLVKAISEQLPKAELLVVGTNSVATESMLKAGAKTAATGENAVIVASKKADIIIGPVGIVIADSLLGEVTSEMAAAIGRSDAFRILIPITKCRTEIAGITSDKTAVFIDDAIEKLKKIEASL